MVNGPKTIENHVRNREEECAGVPELGQEEPRAAGGPVGHRKFDPECLKGAEKGMKKRWKRPKTLENPSVLVVFGLRIGSEGLKPCHAGPGESFRLPRATGELCRQQLQAEPLLDPLELRDLS